MCEKEGMKFSGWDKVGKTTKRENKKVKRFDGKLEEENRRIVRDLIELSRALSSLLPEL